MTVLRADDFPAFFAAINGRQPFAWQRRLAEHVLETGTWPEVIDSPTGSGKSSVIDVHVFAQAVAPAGAGARAPRRLAITVDRRALVDGHYEHAARLLAALGDSDGPAILQAVAHALVALRHQADPDKEVPFVVSRLRGGAVPERFWLDSPTACQVIAATPDMVGSRLLFGGYGSSARARPREAGLLAFDTVFVVDEAHLNRQLLATVRRVGDLVRPDAERLGISAVQAVAMTATQAAAGGVAIGVRAADVDPATGDEILRDRLTRPKPVTLVESEHWVARTMSLPRLAEVLAQHTLETLTATGGPVGCVVNTVPLALEVADRLRTATIPAAASHRRAGLAPQVVTIVGRMRPWELDSLRRTHAGLFTLDGDDSVDVVVATQTVEVGVDMDLSGLVTQVAPGSAIAQRTGRVNRSGSRVEGPVVVVAPAPGTKLEAKTAAPYDPGDLAAATDWLNQLSGTDQGLSSWRIHPAGGGDTPPGEAPRRAVWQRVEPWDVGEWSRTGDDHPAEPALGLWLADSLDPDLTAGVVVRRGLPRDTVAALAQIRVTPPLPQEVFPVPLGDLRKMLFPEDSRRRPIARAFVVRQDEVEAVSGDQLASRRLRPGDIWVVDGATQWFRDGVATWLAGHAAEDVGELGGSPAPAATKNAWARIGKGTPIATDREGRDLPGIDELLHDLFRAAQDDTGMEFEDPLGIRLVRRVSEWLDTLGDLPADPRRMLLRELADAVLAEPSSEGRRRPEVVWHRGLNPDDPAATENFWLVITPAEGVADDETRQTWRPSLGAVDLEAHASAVSATAREIANRLGIAGPLEEALGLAGRLHDAGKADTRFQRLLRARASDYPERILAKSGQHSQQVARRARLASGLPSAWRHEQLSAALAWEELAADPEDSRDLVTRLVGTSHGRGRHDFPHVSRGLLPDDSSEAARLLYDEGEWERLVERTEHTWGTWGCAYLEALLRAADVTASRSGT